MVSLPTEKALSKLFKDVVFQFLILQYGLNYTLDNSLLVLQIVLLQGLLPILYSDRHVQRALNQLLQCLQDPVDVLVGLSDLK